MGVYDLCLRDRIVTYMPNRKTWLYVLGSTEKLEDSYIYVGMTYRLVTRLYEHHNERGSKATVRWHYPYLHAVYCIDDIEQHHHDTENNLTVQLMKLFGSAWWRVRGGKWTSCDKQDTPPREISDIATPTTCFCHLPCETAVSKYGRKYFTCAGKRSEWLDDKIQQDVVCGCGFFKWCEE
jgi:predicted GIY-YIG superfamily endonuclease